MSVEIGIYHPLPPAYHEHDPAAARAAEELINLIGGRNDLLHIEHIGSSAVPGCGGKGYIDLLVTYPPGELESAKQTLQALGFQHQQSGHPFPEERPMRVCSIAHQQRRFSVHAHVVARDATEAHELVRFRDRLRADDDVRRKYEAEKRRILDAGVTRAEEYTHAKTDFIRGVVAQS